QHTRFSRDWSADVCSSDLPAYDTDTEDQDLGRPIRTNSNFNIPSSRATVKMTYEQIISDLLIAIDLLPEKSVHPVSPSKPAAYEIGRAACRERRYVLAPGG